jgi:hypothetical protein
MNNKKINYELGMKVCIAQFISSVSKIFLFVCELKPRMETDNFNTQLYTIIR